MPDQSEPKFVIRTDDGTESLMSYEEVVRWVGVAMSYRLGKALCLTVEGKVLNQAATAAVNWLSASLTQVDGSGDA